MLNGREGLDTEEGLPNGENLEQVKPKPGAGSETLEGQSGDIDGDNKSKDNGDAGQDGGQVILVLSEVQKVPSVESKSVFSLDRDIRSEGLKDQAAKAVHEDAEKFPAKTEEAVKYRLSFFLSIFRLAPSFLSFSPLSAFSFLSCFLIIFPSWLLDFSLYFFFLSFGHPVFLFLGNPRTLVNNAQVSVDRHPKATVTSAKVMQNASVSSIGFDFRVRCLRLSHFSRQSRFPAHHLRTAPHTVQRYLIYPHCRSSAVRLHEKQADSAREGG